MRICEAKFGAMLLCEGDAFRAVAMYGAPPSLANFGLDAIVQPGPRYRHWPIVRTKQVVHTDACATLG